MEEISQSAAEAAEAEEEEVQEENKEIPAEVLVTLEVPLVVWELNSAFSTTEKLPLRKEKVMSKSEELHI